MTPLAGPRAGTVVTVGMFDGMHVGHRAVLDEIARRAALAGRASVLVTFEPHPLEVVNPGLAPARLTTAEERLEMLADSRIDRVLVLAFDRAMSQMEPDAFVAEVLLRRCGMRELVIGHDHGFGHDRSGDVAMLRRLGATGGFPVDVVEPVVIDGRPVSSTAIRQAIAGGNLGEAERLLGRAYTLSARVGRGERRGHRVGFPTANLALSPKKMLPPDGVYAVVVETPAGRFGGMMNQGHRPTFADGRRLLEAHLFGFEGDLYDQWVRIQWIAPLREIRRFADAVALRRQLEDDRIRALGALAHVHPDLDAPISAPE
jgi:riboflavin kinase/FMN adenylyltransferase